MGPREGNLAETYLTIFIMVVVGGLSLTVCFMHQLSKFRFFTLER